MANDFYKENWKTFLKCKQCEVFKEINKDNRYYHNQWFLWVLWRCKECILAWRKTEHELEMSRRRDSDRYYNNPKRREYIFESSRERTKRKWYRNIHLKTSKKIKKLWIRPSVCPICWYSWRIISHHPNYNKWYEIVFCCQICHDKIHRWKIECPQPIDLFNQ